MDINILTYRRHRDNLPQLQALGKACVRSTPPGGQDETWYEMDTYRNLEKKEEKKRKKQRRTATKKRVTSQQYPVTSMRKNQLKLSCIVLAT